MIVILKVKFFSIDIISGINRIYWNCIDDHEGPKTRFELLSSWKEELSNIIFLTGPSFFTLKKFKEHKVNFAYIDGMHDYRNVKKEFDFISSRQSSGDMIILDDVNSSFPEVEKFLDEQKKLETIIYKKLNLLRKEPMQFVKKDELFKNFY